MAYIFDEKAMVAETMSIIHKSKLPQEIKDSWVKFATMVNIDNLCEVVYEDEIIEDEELTQFN